MGVALKDRVWHNWVTHLPNQLTVLRILLTPVFLLLLFSFGFGHKLLALGVFIIASTTDAYDGYLARKYNAVSAFGKFVDPLADKILVLSAFTAFWYLGYFPLWMLLLIALRDIFVTALRMWMSAKKVILETSGFAKSKTAVQMVAIYILLVYDLVAVWPLFDFLDPVLTWIENRQLFWWVMLLVVLLTVGSGVHYLTRNRVSIYSTLRSSS